MAMTVDELIENFELFDSWEDRYRYIIDLGKKLPVMAEEDKTEENKVRGCMSQVWLTHEVVMGDGGNKTIRYTADSDAFIVKGLIGVLFEVMNERGPKDILAVDPKDLMTRIGLENHLSPNRRNGFVAMVDRMQHVAKENA